MSDRTTYHRGARDFGTGYDMMARIVELEAQLAAADELALQLDGPHVWLEKVHSAAAAYRQARDAAR